MTSTARPEQEQTHITMPQQQETTCDWLQTVEFFSAFKASDLADLSGHIESRGYAFADSILSTGEDPDGIYIIKTGIVRLFKMEDGKEKNLGIRKSGQIFPELAALRPMQSEYSVRASARTELLFVSRKQISNLIQKTPESEEFVTRFVAINAAGGLISQLFQLRDRITPDESEEIIRSVGIKKVRSGQTIIEQGDSEDQRLYFIRHGRVSIIRKEASHSFPLASLGAGDLFGEQTALDLQYQPYSVSAESDTVLLLIPQQTVQLILTRNPTIRPVLEKRGRFYSRELERQQLLTEKRARPLLLDFSAAPRSGEKIIKHFQLVEQAEEMDCGAACLAMICRHYGIGISLEKLRELANVTREGATFDSLARAGESLGFTVQGIKCTYNVLLGFDLPFIIHWQDYHYVIVYGLSKKHVWLADPALGFRKLGVAEFEQGWAGNCLSFQPGTDLAEIPECPSPWSLFSDYLKSSQRILPPLFITTLMIALLGLGAPLIIQTLLDRVIFEHNLSLLNLLISALFLVSLFTRLNFLLRDFLALHLGRKLDFAMMSQLFRHTLSLPLNFFTRRQTGDIIARFQENERLRDFLADTLPQLLMNTLTAFFYLAILFFYDLRMTLWLLAPLLPIFLSTAWITPKIKEYSRLALTNQSLAEASLIETFSSAETVKAMGIERPMRLKWEQQYAAALNVKFIADRYTACFNLFTHLLNAFVVVIILWLGVSNVIQHSLSIGQLMAYFMLMAGFNSAVLALTGLWDDFGTAAVNLERVSDILATEAEQKAEDIAKKIVLPDFKGQIRLQDVYFRYTDNRETPYVLENINCTIEPGQMMAIVGPSGSGKTTLAKLLAGFYRPTEGGIFVDDYDLKQVELNSYREKIGYVMQNNLLFSGTISENIAIGDPHPEPKRILEAAKMADAHKLISALPLGYEQPVGERGTGLSGGQIQRLCIARALYRNPRLLIFDEATSALDTQSESNILRNMQDMLVGRTAVVIAHRLSTIIRADKILVLYEGSLVEEGTHTELIANAGMYSQLVQNQITNAHGNH